MIDTQVAILGAGLAGLNAARLLHRAGVDFMLFEARDRPGGRILTADESSEPAQDGFDLGPSWFWPGTRSIDTTNSVSPWIDEKFSVPSHAAVFGEIVGRRRIDTKPGKLIGTDPEIGFPFGCRRKPRHRRRQIIAARFPVGAEAETMFPANEVVSETPGH